VPLSELGPFERVVEDPSVYRKDLRPIEYVVGEMAGRLGAPIYGMLGVEAILKEHPSPDGVTLSGTLTGWRGRRLVRVWQGRRPGQKPWQRMRLGLARRPRAMGQAILISVP